MKLNFTKETAEKETRCSDEKIALYADDWITLHAALESERARSRRLEGVLEKMVKEWVGCGDKVTFAVMEEAKQALAEEKK